MTRPKMVTSTPTFLYPGDVVASVHPAALHTILGPCVAVVIWDAVAGVGGMNHVVLPQAMGREPGLSKFAEPATRLLVQRLTAFGCRRRDLRARLFGGASLSPMADERTPSLGARNVSAVREALASEGIAIVAEEVGGTRGRKIVFHTDTGAYQVRML